MIDMILEQLPGGLDLYDVFKCIFRDHEEGTGVEIDMEEIERLLKIAEVLPFP